MDMWQIPTYDGVHEHNLFKSFPNIHHIESAFNVQLLGCLLLYSMIFLLLFI